VPSLLLIRHAQASFGSADYDVLSDLGLRQAELLGGRLGRLPLTSLTHGELRRQRDTASLLADALDVPTGNPDPRWDEYDHEELLQVAHQDGALEDEMAALADPDADRARAFQRALETALRRWVGGSSDEYRESWSDFLGRCWSAADGLLGGTPASATAGVVTSGGVIAALCCATLDVGPEQWLHLNRVMVNTSVTRLVRGRRGTSVVAINDHAHLEGHDGLLTYR
jgi:broad specificity phosphatase PhoE